MPKKPWQKKPQIPATLGELKDKLLQKADTLDDTTEWIEKPVSPETFILHRDFLHEQALWPAVIDDVIELFSGPDYDPIVQLFVDCEGIGSGKSTKVGLIISYMVYRMLIMRNPYKKYQLRPSTIAFMNMAPSAANAKDIVFNKIKTAINACRWFNDTDNLPDPDIQSSLKFYRPDLLPGTTYLQVIPGNSSSAFPAGADMFGGIIDEAALPGGFETARGDGTRTLFNALNDRRNSRFLDAGLIVLISSAGTVDRFMEEILSACEEKYGTSIGKGVWRDLKIMFRRRALFDVDPRLKNEPRFEHVVVRELPNKKEITYNLQVPERYRESLKSNKYRFLRDLCAIPTSAEHPWVSEWEIVSASLNGKRTDPCPDEGAEVAEGVESIFRRLPDDFSGNKQFKYYAHIDLGTGSGGGSNARDACGIAFGHLSRYAGNKNLPVAYLDLSVRLKAQGEDKITPQAPFELLAKLQKERGFKFKYVTFDGWWGHAAFNTLTELGVKVEHKPVIRDDYDTLWEVIVDKRIDWYRDWWLLKELKSLEEKGAKRIEKSVDSTDDEIECVARMTRLVVESAAKKRATGTVGPSVMGGGGGDKKRSYPKAQGRGQWSPHVG